MLKLATYTPQNLTPEIFAQIVELNHLKFNIQEQTIWNLLADKDLLHIYSDTKTNKIIGVFGFKWIIIDNVVCIYVGNAVIAEEYQTKGLLSRSLFLTTLYTCIKYPFRKKFAIAFITTAEAYQYFKYVKEFWPRPERETPADIFNLEKKYMSAIGANDYVVNHGAIISKKLVGKINDKQVTKKINNELNDYFDQLLHDQESGAQILSFTPINLVNFFLLIKRILGKKIKQLLS